MPMMMMAVVMMTKRGRMAWLFLLIYTATADGAVSDTEMNRYRYISRANIAVLFLITIHRVYAVLR